MLEFRQKQITKKRLYSKPVIFVLIMILIFLARGTWKVYEKSKQSHEKLIVSKEKLEEVDNKREVIENNIDKLNTPKGIEEEIRSKFSVGMSGEAAIVIVHKENKEVLISEEKSFFQKTIDAIKDIF